MRSAKYLFTALGLLPGLALSAGAADDPAGKEAGDKVVITDKDRGGKVTAREGATVLLKLPMQSGTGYSWTVARNSAEKVLKQQGKWTTERPGGRPRPGAAVLQVYTFKAAAPGTSKLEVHYRRPFEKGKEPAKTFTVTVTVK